VLVVGMGVGWWMDHSRLSKDVGWLAQMVWQSMNHMSYLPTNEEALRFAREYRDAASPTLEFEKH
jgi:hypothetical protein